MDLESWSDAELISVRAELHVWCLKRKVPTWGNRFWSWTGYLGAFAFLTGLTDMFFGGPTPHNAGVTALGVIAYLSWYKGDKQRKKNTDFLERLEQELSRRGLSIEQGLT
jgi:hypothetical protein